MSSSILTNTLHGAAVTTARRCAVTRATPLCRRTTFRSLFASPSSSFHTTPIVLKKKQDEDAVIQGLTNKPKRIQVPEHNPIPKKRRGAKIGLPRVHVQDPSTGLVGPLQSLDQLLEDTKDDYIVELIEEYPPTVKLIDIRESRAATLQERLRSKRKGGAETQKVAQISWTMEPADEEHRLRKAREDLEKGNCKVEINFTTKKRQRPPTRPEMQARVDEIAESLEDVAKQWKPLAMTSHTATLYLQSKVRVSNKVSREELMESVPKHIQQKEERKARAEKRVALAEQERLERIQAEEELLEKLNAEAKLEAAKLRSVKNAARPPEWKRSYAGQARYRP